MIDLITDLIAADDVDEEYERMKKSMDEELKRMEQFFRFEGNRGRK